MKKQTYECRKCGIACNGDGVSYELLRVADPQTLVFHISKDMDRYPDHACNQEHVLAVVQEEMERFKPGGKKE